VAIRSADLDHGDRRPAARRRACRSGDRVVEKASAREPGRAPERAPVGCRPGAGGRLRVKRRAKAQRRLGRDGGTARVVFGAGGGRLRRAELAVRAAVRGVQERAAGVLERGAHGGEHARRGERVARRERHDDVFGRALADDLLGDDLRGGTRRLEADDAQARILRKACCYSRPLIDHDHLKVLVVLLKQRGDGALELRAGVAHGRHDQHASNGRARTAGMTGVEAEAAVHHDLGHCACRQTPVAQQLIVRGDRRIVVADIEGRQRVLDPEQIVVKGALDVEPVGARRRDLHGSCEEGVRQRVLALVLITQPNPEERLGAVGHELERREVRLEHLGPRVLEGFFDERDLVQRVPGLLAPARHRGAPPVVAQRRLRVAGIAIALREVEDVPRVVGVVDQRLLEAQRVAAIGVRIASAGAVLVRDRANSLQLRLRPRFFAHDVLVQDALVSPGKRVADKLPARVGPAVERDLHDVHVGGQPRETEVCVQLEDLVRINDEDIVGAPAGQLQRLRAIAAEVPPRALDQLARQVRELLSHDLLGAVGGAGIDDHPRVDQRPHRGKAASDDTRLVLDDHVEAHGLAVTVHAGVSSSR
jgi:hypothetical protein